MKVSVIVTAYNCENYIKKCMDSLVNQTFVKNREAGDEYEIIAVNDGSNDKTGEILSGYEKDYDFVSVINQENSGAAIARNNALKKATGDYVLILDGDDTFEPDMVKEAADKAKKTDADIVVFRSYECYEDDAMPIPEPIEYAIRKEQLPSKEVFSYKDIPDFTFTIFVGWAWDKLIKRKLIVDNNLEFQNLRSTNDMRFTFLAIVNAEKITTVDKLLVVHRMSNRDSLSHTREKSYDCFFTAVKSLKEELIKMGIYEEVERSFLNWSLEFAFWQLDTVGSSAYEKLYSLIKNEFLKEFGHLSKDEDYYFIPFIYDRMEEIFRYDYDWLDYLTMNSRRYFELEKDYRAIEDSTTFKVGQGIMKVPIAIKKKIKGE